MEFEMISEHIWHPVAIQFATGAYRRAMEIRDGTKFVNPREVREQIKFSAMWATNLIVQGFHSGQVERISSSPKS